MENRCFLVQTSSESAITTFKTNEVELMLGFITKKLDGLDDGSKKVARNLIEDLSTVFDKRAVDDPTELPKITLRSAQSNFRYVAIYLAFVGMK